jgi:hypothetical protein
MDFIRPIGPVERDIEPVHRVERATDEREEREREDQREGRARPGPQAAGRRPQEEGATAPEGPVEGDDGHLHIDIRA